VRDVEASRRRLVEAADEERRRLGAELGAGAEQELATLATWLQVLADARENATLHSLVAELATVRDDLGRFAQGVHPRTLTERGLGASLAELAEQAAMPVVLTVPDRRFPAAYEAAAFFVCSEALTNAAKHADASRVDIVVTQAGDRLQVRVSDDGVGGAAFGGGSGLSGLADRVEALGGTLRIDSPAGAGTRLQADLPI
jgi:signal transduction histidine kinase